LTQALSFELLVFVAEVLARMGQGLFRIPRQWPGV